MNENIGFIFITDYWNVPVEEQTRIIAESGWYEEFIREGVDEITAELKREFGNEFVEGRLREIKQNSMKKQRFELDKEISVEWNQKEEEERQRRGELRL